MKKALAVFLAAILILALALPAFADDAGSAANAPTKEQAPSGSSGSSGEVGGIRPVSPEEFAGKVQALGEKLYGAASPVADTVAKLSLAAAGILLILLIVLGAGILRRVVGALFAVAVGLAIWHGAPYIVGVIKYITNWLMS
ncbi:MAG: hypothetical protein ACPLTR_08490 [Thermacetogeniaceae bacterium]